MKNTLPLVFVIACASCGLSNDEKLIHDYQSKKWQNELNVDIYDFDFTIESISQTDVITAYDSLRIIKDSLLSDIAGKEAASYYIDTIKFAGIMKLYDQRIGQYQNLVTSSEKLSSLYKQNGRLIQSRSQDKESEKYREKILNLTNDKNAIILYEQRFESPDFNPDEVLSRKLVSTFSMTNPVLKIKQTFTKNFYTNEGSNTIVSEEEIDK